MYQNDSHLWAEILYEKYFTFTKIFFIRAKKKIMQNTKNTLIKKKKKFQYL